MGVKLREKKMKDGQVSFYLDIYHQKKRWYEFLDIHACKTKPTEVDREKKRMATEIRARRENELIVSENGLIDKSKRKADFICWFDAYMKARGLNNTHNRSAILHLRRYQNDRPLPFNEISPEWLKSYTKYLLTKVSNNTTMDYLKNLSTAFDEAVRQDIIMTNPLRKIPKHEKLKRKKTFRTPFSLDELQVLANTSCKIPGQYQQAFFFACFSGLRWSDLNPLSWSEIIIKTINGVEEWFMYFEQEKTEDIEYIPLSEQAVIILKERMQERDSQNDKSPYVFPQIKETSNPEENVIHKRFSYYLKKWASAAGLDPKRMFIHNARHAFATNLMESCPEVDLWTLSKLLGHRTMDATQIYAHMRDNRKKSAVKGMPTLNFKQIAA